LLDDSRGRFGWSGHLAVVDVRHVELRGFACGFEFHRGIEELMVNIGAETAAGRLGRSQLAELLRNTSYEVMPLGNAEAEVVEHVPVTVPLTVTVTEAKGIQTTLALTERLTGRGYRVSPHLPARQFIDQRHVDEVVTRLNEQGVRSIFVIGGDALEPAGDFADAFALLQAIEAIGHRFEQVGIGGYPEGQAKIPDEALALALKQKAPMATRVLTQICFDATATTEWAAGVAACGVDLPIFVGMPGPVSRQKLVRISTGIGLGRSARFLQKQPGLLRRFLLPGAYDPTKLARRLAAAAPTRPNGIRGLHIFTFNELRGTEQWRQELLAAVAEKG
jgi:methylenetetrahydrofolate reductase (NADPH)